MEAIDEKYMVKLLSRIKTPDGKDLFLAGVVKITSIEKRKITFDIFVDDMSLKDIEHIKNYILRRLQRYNLEGEIKVRR